MATLFPALQHAGGRWRASGSLDYDSTEVDIVVVFNIESAYSTRPQLRNGPLMCRLCTSLMLRDVPDNVLQILLQVAQP